MRKKNTAVDKEQQPQEEQRTQLQMFDALDRTALLPSVTFETLLATSKNFPALNQWELVVEHGCASMHDVDKECKLWKIAQIQPLPSLHESFCNPDDDFERVAGMAEDFYDFLSDLEDWCIMELLDIHHQTAERHLLALRDDLAATLALAQKASRSPQTEEGRRAGRWRQSSLIERTSAASIRCIMTCLHASGLVSYRTS